MPNRNLTLRYFGSFRGGNFQFPGGNIPETCVEKTLGGK